MINYILFFIFLVVLILYVYKKVCIIEGAWKNPLKSIKKVANDAVKSTGNVVKNVANNPIKSIGNVVNKVVEAAKEIKPSWPKLPPPPKPINKTVCYPPRDDDGKDDWCDRNSKLIQQLTDTRSNLNTDIYNLEEKQKEQIEHIKSIEANIYDLTEKKTIISNKRDAIRIEVTKANDLYSSLDKHKNYIMGELKKKTKEGSFKDISITNIYA